jgi:hypothetical protein
VSSELNLHFRSNATQWRIIGRESGTLGRTEHF